MKSRSVVLFLVLAGAMAWAQGPLDGAEKVLQAAAGSMPAEKNAEPITLDEALAAAMRDNAEIRAAERQVAAAQSQKPIAGALDDPQLMVKSWGVPLRQPWNANQSQNMIMYAQSLPGPGKRALRTQVAAEDVAIAQAALAARQRDVASRVRKSYLDLLRNADEMRVHDDQVALARQALQSARVKYVVGRVPQQDVLKAQVALTKLAEHLVGLEQDGAMARAELNTLMGRDPAAPLAVRGAYMVPQELPAIAALERVALQHRPELAAAALAVRQGELRSKLAEKTMTPDFSLSGGYMINPPGAMARNTFAAEVSMTLPWLNRGRHDAEVASAAAMTAAAKSEVDVQKAAVFQEIQQALVKAQAAEKLVALYRDTLRPQARAVLKAASIAYQNDRTDLLNLLDSQNATLDVEQSYFRSLSDLDARLADLERAVGTELPRGNEVAGAAAQAVTQPAGSDTKEVRP